MKELLILITLAMGVAIGFAGCGDDDCDEETTAPVEMTADAAGEAEAVVDAGVVADTDTEEAAGGAGGEAVEETEEAAAGTAGAGGEATEESEAEAGAAGAAGEEAAE